MYLFVSLFSTLMRALLGRCILTLSSQWNPDSMDELIDSSISAYQLREISAICAYLHH